MCALCIILLRLMAADERLYTREGLNSWIRQVMLFETAHRYLELLTIRRVSAQNLTFVTHAVECTALKAVLF
jgi:hypothetical protein